VSQDGRTYTFRIKHGLRFSPPSNQPVTAATFKYSIERALSPVLGAGPPALRLAADIRGVRAYRAGKARHIQGVRAHGDTLAITLAHRAPDIADRIAAPQFCPVPLGTPIAAAGDHDEPIPAAGPYYLSANAGGELAVIRRNPNYNGSRPHRVDAMIFRGRVPLAKTIARVAAGADDYAAEDGPALEADGLIARRFGRGSETGRRFQRTPLLGTDVLAFNMQRGLLRDPRVRRAVNYAIDRPAIAAALGDSATDRYLPADMPGSRAGHVYPLHRSNPHRARMLMGDRGTRLVVAVCSEPRCARVGRLVAADLQRVGIRVRLRNYRGDIASRTHRAATDIVLARILAPYPDPVAFMRNALGVAAKGLGVEKLAHLNRPRRLSAAGRLELALLRHRPPAAAIGTPTVPEFFSARVGCKKPSSLSFGVELGSLCLRRP